jgi:hypothetical protein
MIAKQSSKLRKGSPIWRDDRLNDLICRSFENLAGKGHYGELLSRWSEQNTNLAAVAPGTEALSTA